MDLAPKFTDDPGQSTVDLTATDALGMMQRRRFIDDFETECARSIMGNLVYGTSLGSGNPVFGAQWSHYPLTEDTAATAYYDIVGYQPSTYIAPFTAQYSLGGSVTPGGDNTFPDGRPCVSVSSGAWLRTFINLNYVASFGGALQTGNPVLRVWVNLQSSGEVLSFSSAKRAPGTAFNATYDGVIAGYAMSTNTLSFQDSAGSVSSTTVAKGWHLIEVRKANSGGDTFYVDTVLIGTSSAASGATWYNLGSGGKSGFYATLGGTISAGYRNFGLYYSLTSTGIMGGPRIPFSTTTTLMTSTTQMGAAPQSLGRLLESPIVPLRGGYLGDTTRSNDTVSSITFAAGVVTVNTSTATVWRTGDTVVISGNSTAANNGAFTIDVGGTGTFKVINSLGVATGASGYVSIHHAGADVATSVNSGTSGYVAPVDIAGRTAYDVFLEWARMESGRVYCQYYAYDSRPTIVPSSLVRHSASIGGWSITATAVPGSGQLSVSAIASSVKPVAGMWALVAGNSTTANNGIFQISVVQQAATGGTMTLTLNHPGGAAVTTNSGTVTVMPAPMLTVDAEADLAGAPTLIRESANAINSATASSTVASVTATDNSLDPRTSNASVSVQAAAANPAVLYSLATQQVAASKYAGLRATDLTVDLATSQNDLYSQFFAMFPGNVVTLNGLPSTYLGVSSMNGVVEGWTERPSLDGYTVTLNLSPMTPRESSYSTNDSFGFGDGIAYLNAAITSSATSLQLAWTSGDVLSTSSLTDYPLDLNVNGERVTVTAAPAGSTSPQTLTVTRGIAPTVARAHNQYEPVELWTPATLAP